MFSFFYYAMCYWLFFTLAIYGADLDKRPGSYSIYVKNHDKKPSMLYLCLRKQCRCKNKPIRPCACFVSAEGQPTIQGDARNAIRYYARYDKNKLFPGCSFIFDKSTGEQIITIPSPNLLFCFLPVLKLDSHFVLVDGSKPLDTDDYLQLIEQEKIPIGGIPEIHEVENNSMLYHLYFHDLFNHVFLWAALPPYFKTMISKKVREFLYLVEELKKENSNDSALMNFLELLKFMMAMEFDISEASLHNSLVHNVKDLHKILERMINLGIYSQDPYKITSLDRKFLLIWIKRQTQIIKNDLEGCIKSNDESLSFIVPHISKTSKTYKAFKDLFLLGHVDFKNISDKLFVGVSKVLKNRPDRKAKESIVLDEFIASVRTRWEGILNEAQRQKEQLNQCILACDLKETISKI